MGTLIWNVLIHIFLVLQPTTTFINVSTHQPIICTTSPQRSEGGKQPIPADIGWEAGSTLDRSPVYHRANMQRQTTCHSQSPTYDLEKTNTGTRRPNRCLNQHLLVRRQSYPLLHRPPSDGLIIYSHWIMVCIKMLKNSKRKGGKNKTGPHKYTSTSTLTRTHTQGAHWNGGELDMQLRPVCETLTVWLLMIPGFGQRSISTSEPHGRQTQCQLLRSEAAGVFVTRSQVWRSSI